MAIPLAAGISAACSRGEFQAPSPGVNAPPRNSARPWRVSGPSTWRISSATAGSAGGPEVTSGDTRSSSAAGRPIQASAPMRAGELVGHEAAERPALGIDAAHQLAGQPAELTAW